MTRLTSTCPWCTGGQDRQDIDIMLAGDAHSYERGAALCESTRLVLSCALVPEPLLRVFSALI